MYKHHNWDEDKLDPLKQTGNYAGQTKKEPGEGYHKQDVYGSKESQSDVYQSGTANEDVDKKHKEEESSEPNIDQKVKEELPEEEEQQKKDPLSTLMQEQSDLPKTQKPIKKNKSIEEAISKAITAEKELHFER